MQSTQVNALQWWLRYNSKGQTATARWFFFHHAGGSASSYARWIKHIPKNVEMLSLELPGRGNRFHEPSPTQWHRIIPPITHSIENLLDLPFIFFGHSMGASIAFEVCQLLGKHHRPLAKHLFLAGRQAPNRPCDLTSHHLPDDEFIEYLREKQGTPEEVLQDPDLMQLLLPRLRADFQLNDHYQPYQHPRLPIPITVYAGTDEEGERIDFADWAKQTSSSFELQYLKGSHFFINDHIPAIIQDIINKSAT
jgi:medium-chain acyl-[acyl-carrier-protein] hydrolase